MEFDVQIKPVEVTHKMQLIMRIIRHGYEYAQKGVLNEDEDFFKEHKDKSKEELLKEYKELKYQLH